MVFFEVLFHYKKFVDEEKQTLIGKHFLVESDNSAYKNCKIQFNDEVITKIQITKKNPTCYVLQMTISYDFNEVDFVDFSYHKVTRNKETKVSFSELSQLLEYLEKFEQKAT